MVREFRGEKPEIAGKSYIAPGAQVIGKVKIAENASVWPNAVLRGDMEEIRIGRGSNVQDNCTLHTDHGVPLVIGENVTIGHNAVLHSCTVGDGSLIGISAVVLNGAVIGKGCLVGAGALVTPRTQVPDGSMVLGGPAKVKRALTEEEKRGILENGEEYVRLAAEYAE